MRLGSSSSWDSPCNFGEKDVGGEASPCCMNSRTLPVSRDFVHYFPAGRGWMYKWTVIALFDIQPIIGRNRMAC